jgi:Pro-kumamolisin, activation domain/Bacterial Ig-like domain (group 3)
VFGPGLCQSSYIAREIPSCEWSCVLRTDGDSRKYTPNLQRGRVMKTTSTLILRNSLLLLSSIVMFFSLRATAQTTPPKMPAARITEAIEAAKLAPTGGIVHSQARPEFDRGLVADSQQLTHIMLLLRRSPGQEAALLDLMNEQQTKNSPNYHAWLTPAQFGQQFGVADADIQKVTAWLSQQGFADIKVTPSKTLIEFSGTAGMVRNAFHTELHNFMVNGKPHMANVSRPQIPAALAPVISGVVSLHNFRKQSFLHNSRLAAMAKAEGKLKPGFSATPCAALGPATCFALGPADFAKIYNIPSTLTGTGRTIALVARSNINLQDITDYRTGFGLPGTFTSANIVLASSDPGIVPGDDAEATLDVEVSSAVAPNANIMLVVADGTVTTSFADGVDISAIYIIQNNLADVMSESFGSAEEDTFTPFYQGLWEQGAAQGISIMLSSGDVGSAAIDGDLQNIEALNGLSISGLASTPFNVAVGGTDFDDAANPQTFWNTTNTGAGKLSALSYIPETTWNNSCAATATTGSLLTCANVSPDQFGNDLVAGSGGQSGPCGLQDPNTGNCLGPIPKPTWQAGTGVPADAVRDIPDISLFASNGAHGNFWVMCFAGTAGVNQQDGQPCNLAGPNFNFTGVGGTSASSPAFAGIMALVDQSQSGRQGLPNFVLYPLAQTAGANCNSSTPGTITNTNCIFYDVTKGNNSVECAAQSPNCSNQTTNGHGVLVEPNVAPFSSTTPAWNTTNGFDLATGLGSVNVTNLTGKWNTITGAYKGDTTAITLPAAGSVTITHGASVNFTVKVAQTSGTAIPTGDVSLVAEPPGFPQMTVGGATLDNTGTAVFTGVNGLPGDNTTGAGTAYPVIAHYAGDGTFMPSDSPPFNVTVNRENSSVAAAMLQWWANTPTVITSAPYGSLYLFRYDVLGSAPSDNQVCANVAIPCPTGTITVTHDGGTPLNDFLNTATGTSTNVATLNVLGLVEDRVLGSTGLPGGAHTIVAAYSGDNSYNPSTGTALAFTITPASTQTLVTVNGQAAATVQTGQQVSLVATVQTTTPLPGVTFAGGSAGAGPTGSVTFSACGTAGSCTVTVVPTAAGNTTGAAFATATLPTTFTTAGTQNITATFTSADGNYFSCTTTVNTATQRCTLMPLNLTVTSAASKLAFTVQPTNVAVTASITPPVQVTVEDSTGAVVASATNPVTIAIGNNAGPGGVLAGTLTATPVNGIATFSNLSINKTGTAYTLTASATGLTSATSSAFNVTGATGSFAISYSPNPLVLSSTTGAAAPLTVTVTPSGGFLGQVTLTATAASLPPGVTCPNSPLNINIVAASPVANTLNCQVTATSTTLTASVLREQRMYDAKVMSPTQTIPPATGGKGWWALSAGTGFAALFLMFLPGGRKKYRAALGLGLVCLLGITLGCNGVYNGGTKPPVATTTQMTVTNASAKVNSGTAFIFSVTVTGGTPGGMAQLFDGGQAISTAGASATVSGGKATLTGPTTLSVGTHSISVHYLGDTTTLASQSGSLNLTVAGGSTIAVTTTPAATPVAAAINITVQ